MSKGVALLLIDVQNIIFSYEVDVFSGRSIYRLFLFLSCLGLFIISRG
ncbi:hypothetical protein ACUIAK_13240 [Bacillus cytotoxicus]